MAWVRPRATDGLRNIVEHGYRTGPHQEVGLRINGGNYQILSWDGSDHVLSYAIPAGDLNAWVHLVGTYDGSAWQLCRNGVEVGPCTGAPQAVPAPCVESRQDLADGGAQLVSLTSQASEWRFGTPRVTRGLAFAVASPETGGVLSLSASSHNGVPLGGLAYLKGGAVFRSAGLIAFAVDAGRRAWIGGIGHDGRRFLLYAEDNGPSGDRIRLWIDGVGQSGEGALRSGGVWIRP